VLLPNKQLLPLVGLGTYKLQDEAQLVELLKKGLEIGIRHIDTARLYNNEIPLGNAINQMIK
jgi:2,5-diketo-D-gluconate reductase A